jgi:hypothetical protein
VFGGGGYILAIQKVISELELIVSFGWFVSCSTALYVSTPEMEEVYASETPVTTYSVTTQNTMTHDVTSLIALTVINRQFCALCVCLHFSEGITCVH